MPTDTNENLEHLRALPGLLLCWYDQQKRAMPWRDAHNSYYTWVSEIMLQQTRVEAVRDYFARFIRALPDISSLASCDESQLMKLWEGLGYYNRARNLQKAAREVMDRHAGRLPADYEQLLALPGIGEYTAGAIASIAFGIPVPCVDGNVLRVISRLTANRSDISLPAVKRDCRTLVQGLIPPGRAGDFNQSLMELGAIVCLPVGAPRCTDCPAAGLCRAHQAGEELDYPVKAAKATRKMEERTILLLVRSDRVLLQKRPSSGLLGGLWEFPALAGHPGRDAAAAELSAAGYAVRKLHALKPAKHIFSHIEWRMQGYLAEVEGAPAADGGCWASWEELHRDHALPSAFSFYLKALKGWWNV